MKKNLTIREYREDEELIEDFRKNGSPRVRVYHPLARCVVLGRGSKEEQELRLENCIDDEVPIFRRRGGGCSVFLDEGNVIISLVTAASGFGRINHYFREISCWFIKELESLGIFGITQRGISDLARKDKKIGGSCLYREKKLLYYSTTLLFDPQVDLIERYLQHPPREPDYRRGRAHRDFLSSLCNCSPFDSRQALEEQLKSKLKAPCFD